MTRALYHAFKLYIKIHGETFCCLTFLGGKNFEQHFPDLGDWKSPYIERAFLLLTAILTKDILLSVCKKAAH
jgi:hypothetical protein